MTPPTYLALYNLTPDEIFDENESLYRRFPCSKPPHDFFTDTSWEYIKKGISVNRSKYSKNEEDVLWSFVELGNNKCDFQLSKNRVIATKASNFNCKDPKTGAELILSHKPVNCNYSHCDIDVKLEIKNPNSSIRRDIRAFISSLFQETDVNNC